MTVRTNAQYVARHLEGSNTEQDTLERTQEKNHTSAHFPDVQRGSLVRTS